MGSVVLMKIRSIGVWGLLAVVIGMVAIVGWSTPASAHTDFVASTPADGAAVDGPVSSVTVEFTNPAIKFGDGFQLLEPDGTVRAPDSLDATDGTMFVATFDPPLVAGSYGFRWHVQAGDAHPIQGSFQFTVVGPSTTAPPVTAAASAPGGPATTNPALVDSAPTTVAVDHSTMAMDDFLDGTETVGPFAGRVARTISILSTMFAVGVTAAAVWVIRGQRNELERLRTWVRLAGLGLVTGGTVTFAALADTWTGSAGELLRSKPGVAAALTTIAGVLVMIGFGMDGLSGASHSLSAAVQDATTGRDVDRSANDDVVAPGPRWVLDATSAVGGGGLACALAAFWFDGHTVSRGPWAVHGAVNLVHVTAASVWVGGVFAMTLVAWMRKRRRHATDVVAMVVRFSSIATAALAAVAGAGLVLAWLVLDSPSEVWSTEWGRVLLIKVGAVAVAAAVGGYNHYVLRPALEARPDDQALASQLRPSLVIESVVMVAVVVITAVLVASSI